MPDPQRKIIYTMMVSLDGFVEDRNGSIDWVIIDQAIHTHANQQARLSGEELYGRRMWQTMAPFWTTAGDDPAAPPFIIEFAQIWNATPKVVFSSSLPAVSGSARLERGSAVEEAARLKALPGKDLSVSGATLAASLIQHNLVDEYCLYLNPVLLGGGKPMFPSGINLTHLRLIETHAFQAGVLFLRYAR